eukprot:gene5474-8335_t
MGIQKLRSSIEDCASPISLRALSGQTVGVDIGCLYPLVSMNAASFFAESHPHTKYIEAVVSWCISKERKFGIRLVIVFDGAPLPAKAAEDARRLRDRIANRAKGDELMRHGDPAGAQKKYRGAFTLDFDIAKTLVESLRANGIETLTAPFEADPQLVHLVRIGYIDALLTTDTDLLAYELECPVILDLKGATGTVYDLTRSPEYDWTGFTSDLLLANFILNGCDFLATSSEVTFKTTHHSLREAMRENPADPVHGLISRRRCRYGADGISAYERMYYRAFIAFRHAVVFDPKSNKAQHLTPLDRSLPELAGLPENDISSIVGHLPKDARWICQAASMHPEFHRPFDVTQPVYRNLSSYLSKRGFGQSLAKLNAERSAQLRNPLPPAPISKKLTGFDEPEVAADADIAAGRAVLPAKTVVRPAADAQLYQPYPVQPHAARGRGGAGAGGGVASLAANGGRGGKSPVPLSRGAEGERSRLHRSAGSRAKWERSGKRRQVAARFRSGSVAYRAGGSRRARRETCYGFRSSDPESATIRGGPRPGEG